MSVEHISVTVGAIYGAIQAIAQAIMLLLPSNTVAWAIAKFIVAGPARPTSDQRGPG